jgi:hypothetical protein
MIKTLRKLGTEGVYLNIIKAINDIANITLSREKLKLFPLKSGMRQGCSVSPLLFNIVLEFLARAIRQEKEIKGIQRGKKQNSQNIPICRRHDPIPQKLHPKTFRHHKELQQCNRIKINLQNSAAFLYTNNQHIDKEYRKTIPFTIASKKKLYT